MTLLLGSDEFRIGRHGVVDVDPRFQQEFLRARFEATTPTLECRRLRRRKTDGEILAEWKPEEVPLGDFAFALADQQLLKRPGSGYASIFYVRAQDKVLWALYAYFGAERGWKIGARSLDGGDVWYDDDQVISRAFGAPETFI